MPASGRQFKFDKNNPKHVEMLKTAAGNDEVTIYPGGLIGMGMKASPQIEAQKNSESKGSNKAVAKKSRGSTLESKTKRKPETQNQAKKTPGFLAKARAAEDAAKKRGDVSEGLENPKDKK